MRKLWANLAALTAPIGWVAFILWPNKLALMLLIASHHCLALTLVCATAPKESAQDQEAKG